MKEEIQIDNNVAKLRRMKGYTQMDLAKLTYLSQQYISNVERRILTPSLQKAIIIAEALDECCCNVFFKSAV